MPGGLIPVEDRSHAGFGTLEDGLPVLPVFPGENRLQPPACISMRRVNPYRHTFEQAREWGGRTGRSAPGRLPLDERIGRCEELYVRQGLPPSFKMWPGTAPADLDAELERRGYGRAGVGTMRVLEELPAGPPWTPPGIRAAHARQPSEAWFRCFAGGRGLAPRQEAAARAFIGRIVPERSFILLEAEDGPAACALVVAEPGWAGVASVAVRPDLRGRGLGRGVMAHAHAEAALLGARRTYLMVLDDNAVAGNQYLSLGYRVAQASWSRVKLWILQVMGAPR